MKMTRMLCGGILASAALVLATGASAQAPIARLDDAYPGLYMNFDDETSDFNGWGYKEIWNDNHWDFTGGVMTAVTEGSWARVRTGPKGDHENAFPPPDDLDSVLSLTWTNNAGSNTRIFDALQYDTSGFGDKMDVISFRGVASGPGNTTFELKGGDGSGAWVTVGTFDIPIGQTHKLTLAYTAADGLLDFYVDDDLAVADFVGRSSPPYDLWRILILGGAPAGDVLDEIIIGLGEVGLQYTPGDADKDGDVDDDDLSILLANWAQDTNWDHGEFSGTPPVDDNDLSLLLANWTGAAAVPEPMTVALLLVAAPALLSRRHGRAWVGHPPPAEAARSTSGNRRPWPRRRIVRPARPPFGPGRPGEHKQAPPRLSHRSTFSAIVPG